MDWTWNHKRTEFHIVLMRSKQPSDCQIGFRCEEKATSASKGNFMPIACCI